MDTTGIETNYDLTKYVHHPWINYYNINNNTDKNNNNSDTNKNNNDFINNEKKHEIKKIKNAAKKKTVCPAIEWLCLNDAGCCCCYYYYFVIIVVILLI